MKALTENLLHQRLPILEVGVKIFKYRLKRVMVNTILTYEDFLTVITQTEGILNSRSLVPFSSDLDDLNVLTLDHFLIKTPLKHITEPVCLGGMFGHAYTLCFRNVFIVFFLFCICKIDLFSRGNPEWCLSLL